MIQIILHNHQTSTQWTPIGDFWAMCFTVPSTIIIKTPRKFLLEEWWCSSLQYSSRNSPCTTICRSSTLKLWKRHKKRPIPDNFGCFHPLSLLGLPVIHTDPAGALGRQPGHRHPMTCLNQTLLLISITNRRDDALHYSVLSWKKKKRKPHTHNEQKLTLKRQSLNIFEQHIEEQFSTILLWPKSESWACSFYL